MPRNTTQWCGEREIPAPGLIQRYLRARESRPRTWGRVLTVFFLIALAILWIAVLVPAMVRARAATPLRSTDRFKARMDLIAPPGPRAGRWVVVLPGGDRGSRSTVARAQRLARARRRRRRLLTVLVLAALGTAAAAVLEGGGPWWEVHAAVDTVLVLFVGALLETKKRRAERLTKVRRLHRRSSGHTEPRSIAAGGRS